jgi:hypothetical protein
MILAGKVERAERKDVNRQGDFPVIAFDLLGFQFRARKTMWRKGKKRIFAHSFQPAASPPGADAHQPGCPAMGAPPPQ